MSKANVYQQRPEPGVHAESPLHHAELHKLAGKTAAKAGIVLREKKLLGHLVLRGDAADRPSPPPCTRPSAWNCRWP